MSTTFKTQQMELIVNTKASVALFVIKGKIGWDYARQLDGEINRVITEGYTRIVLNLDEVSFLCSGGIGALVYHMNRVQKKNGDIYIVSNSDYIQYLFATIGFNMVFRGKIFETFEKFNDTVLSSRGLTLNPQDSFYTNLLQAKREDATESMEQSLVENDSALSSNNWEKRITG